MNMFHVSCLCSCFEENRRDELRSVSVTDVSGGSHERAAECCREAGRALNQSSMEWSWFCIGSQV